MLNKNLKRFLMVGIFSIHLTYSAEMPEVARLQDEIQIASQRVRMCRETYGDTNSVIVIGRTGRGKSTLITHLADRPIIARAGDIGLTLNTEIPLPDFHIGEGVVAVGTRMPSAWYDSTSNVVYWDCPGFGDPRGPTTDIINAFSVQQLFQAPSRAKIVIVIQESDFQGRAESFGALLNQVVTIFPDNSQLERCLSLVVTRQRDVNVEGIMRAIYGTAEENDLFKVPRVKSLVKFLSDNTATRVSCMPYPAAIGPYVGNRESILKSIVSTDYVFNPVFKISISAESRDHVRQLLNNLNRVIKETLQESEAPVVEALYGEVLRFEGSSDDLRQKVKTTHEFVNALGDVSQESEFALRFFEIPGLPDPIRQSLASRIDQIHVLKTIRGEGGTADIFFATNEWFAGLSRMRQQLDDLWTSLQTYVRITKTPIAESFTTPVSEGIIREEEIFRLPDGREKTTFKDLRASRLLSYTHEDQSLRSIPKEIYTIQRAGGEENIFDGNVLPPVAYTQTNITRTIVPGTLNLPASNVSLIINRTYQRADDTLYLKDEILSPHPIMKTHLRYDHNNAAHYSTKVVQCSAIHEGFAIPLGEGADGNVAHTLDPELISSVIEEKEGRLVYRCTYRNQRWIMPNLTIFISPEFTESIAYRETRVSDCAALGGKTVFLKNVQTGRCLDSNHAGKLYTLGFNGGGHQKWIVSRDEGGYSFKNVATNRFLDSGLVEGGPHAYPTGDTPFQKWTLSSAAAGGFMLVSVRLAQLGSSYALDSNYAGDVYTHPSYAGPHQSWIPYAT